MKTKSHFFHNDYVRLAWVATVLLCFGVSIMFIARTTSAGSEAETESSLSPLDDPNFPREFDVRAIHGTPRGTDLPVPGLPSPSLVQLKALNALRNRLGLAADDARLRIDYNGLTATPRHIVNQGGFLSEPSALPAEQIALDFIRRSRETFRFSESDLNNLKLASRAVSANGTTTVLYNQTVNGMSVYRGDVMVNVAKNGQIINVGGENYPQLVLTNAAAISASQAIENAAAALNVSGFTPQSLGTTQILTTYGNLKPEFVTGEKFSRGTAFGDDIVVSQVIFPMGLGTARLAYKFTLTTPQYYGMMWQHFVDAQTGETLRRSSLTAFQKGHGKHGKESAKKEETGSQNFGTPGGGVGVGRLGTFRPDVQNFVEAMNNAGTARGKTIDGMPTMLSGFNGFGRSTRVGANPATYLYTAPTYASDTLPLEGATGRGFRYVQANGRIEFPLPWNNDLLRPTFSHAQIPGLMGQITRGFPDAANPSNGSPFGWFYLPTDSGGAEITVKNNNRMTTRGLGYAMDADAVTRNQAFAGNSPTGDGTQPFAADLTALPSAVQLADGRTLSTVFQSRYTEGNNALIADDRVSNNEADHGIKGYSANRQFTAPYYDYYSSYEYGGIDAGGTPFFPPTTDADVPPAAVALFYYNNVLHDYLYDIGFTEQFWNFQMDNFGKGGAGSDFVSAQVMDGSGTNNANFGTPADGGMPRMQMFLFTEAQRRSDGDFDFEVVAHELYHGVSNRSAAKGGSGCLGITLVGESGGMGEGWGDFIASSMTDDDVTGEFVTGNLDRGIRRLPMTNYRWSYAAADHRTLDVRRTDPTAATLPDLQNPTSQTNPFAVHPIGELWSSTLWDMRELLIMKQNVGGSYPGVFFDGTRRLGSGTNFYVGYRQLQSKDAFHPINYRPEFNSTRAATPPNTLPVPNILADHFVRPNLVAQENASNPLRNGPLATAVSRGGRLADQLVLRGLQIAPCNPSFVEMRDSILAADSEITGGENRAVIWRAFASHGVGMGARSTGGTGGTDPAGGAQSAPVIVEDFGVPANVTACELNGPLAAPTFTLANSSANTVTVSITAVPNAASYTVARGTNANGPFTTVGTTTTTTFTDNNSGAGLTVGQTYYYQVRANRNADCVGSPNTQNITITVGAAPVFTPVFFGVNSVSDPRTGTSLNLSWTPAVSLNPNASIVYDVFRVTSITSANGQTDSTTAPTFATTTTNKIADGVSGNCAVSCSYTDTNLTLGQIYYYIVQARDTNNGRIDTNNTGNRVGKFNAPTTTNGGATAFALENFETTSANTRFTPALVTQSEPNMATPLWQRVANVEMLGAGGDQLVQTSAMFAPDFDPPADGTGAPSDISTTIGPITLTTASILEFDSRHVTEFAFDGGVVEVILGAPVPSTTFPNNVSSFDLNYFLIDNGYTGKLDGTLAGPVMLSPLQGRFAFTGTRATTHIRAALGSFAPGGALNAGGLPVYLRFRSVSDPATSPGAGAGWYIDNLVVTNYARAIYESDVSPRPDGDTFVDATDITQIRRFSIGLDAVTAGGSEFQRADAAPLASFGDGQIDALDITQCRRYAIGLDALQPSQGPMSANAPLAERSGRSASSRSNVRVVNAMANAGKTVTVVLEADAIGEEGAYNFTLNYDAAVLGNPRVAMGAGAAGGNVLTNMQNAGRIGFSVDFGGSNMTAGRNRQFITITFDVAKDAAAGKSALTFSDDLARRSVSSVDVRSLPTGFTGGVVQIGGK